jgi:hypothetical protein
LILYGDGEIGPVEERVPDSEVELVLKFLYDRPSAAENTAVGSLPTRYWTKGWRRRHFGEFVRQER